MAMSPDELRKRAAAQAKRITAEHGENAYGGVKFVNSHQEWKRAVQAKQTKPAVQAVRPQGAGRAAVSAARAAANQATYAGRKRTSAVERPTVSVAALPQGVEALLETQRFVEERRRADQARREAEDGKLSGAEAREAAGGVLERIGNTLAGAGKQYAGSMVNVGGWLAGQSRATDDEALASLQRAAEAQRRRAEDPGLTEAQRAQNAAMAERTGRILEGRTNSRAAAGALETRLTGTADRLAQSGAADLEEAKDGLNAAGRFLVDVGAGAAQLGGDILLGLATGGSALVPMALRGFGGGTQEARLAGADTQKQGLYGAASAAVSVLTEKISNVAAPLARAFGRGVADDAIETGVRKALDSLAKTDAGRAGLQRLGTVLLSAGGEGAEELLEGAVQPILQRLTYDPNAEWDWSDIARQGLIGAAIGGAMGGLGGSPGEAEWTNTPAVSEAAQAQKTAPTEGAESTAVNTDPARHTAAEQAVIEAYQQSSDPLILAFLQRVRSLQNQDYKNKIREDIKTSNHRALAAAGTLTGISTDGYRHIINGNAVQHIDRRHGKSGTADHSMENDMDFSRIGFVLDNFTNAELLTTGELDTETAKISREWRNSDNSSAPVVRYSLPVNGTYYVVEAVPSSKARSLAVISAYMSGNKKRGASLNQELFLPAQQASSTTSETNLDFLGDSSFRSTDQVLNMPESGPQRTPETPHGANTPVSDTTIPQREGGVKTEYAREGGKNTIPAEIEALLATANRGRETPEGLGAASAGFDPYSHWQNQTGDFHPAGENPARLVELPKTDPQGRATSATARTAMEAEITPEAMLPGIEAAAAAGDFSYNRITNRKTLAKAEAEIRDAGFHQAYANWRTALGKRANAKTTVMGWSLYNAAANAGDTGLALDILQDITASTRAAAQALQAQRLVKRMSPQGQLYAAQRTVQNLQRKLAEKYGDTAPGLEIDTALAEEFLAAADQDARDAVMAEIYKDIGRQIPATWQDKWNAWRYLAMLGNPRTHIRNILGNAGFVPVRKAKDAIAMGLERIFMGETGADSQRTKAALNLTSAEDRALLQFAKEDFSKVKDVAMGEGKFEGGVNANKAIREGQRIFGKPLSEDRSPLNRLANGLEAARRFSNDALDAGDRIFSKTTYAGALAGFLKARGVTAEMLQAGAQAQKNAPYTQQEADAIRYEGKTFRNIVAGLDAKVSDFFQRWKDGRKSHQGEKLEKLYLGKLTEESIESASNILGYEITDRDVIVTNDDVKHISDRHPDLDPWVFDSLPELVKNPDTIRKGHGGSGKNAGKTGVIFEKTLPGGTVVSIQFDNAGRGTLQITTVYVKEGAPSEVIANELTNTPTPEASEPAPSANNIPHPNAMVNNKMDLVPADLTDTGTRLPQGSTGQGPSEGATPRKAEALGAGNLALPSSDTTIPQGESGVNTEYAQGNGTDTDLAALLEEGRAYAIREAQRATYRDRNAFSDLISALGFRHPDTTAKKVANALIEGVLPFKRTPANILVRGMEYSPAGLVKGLTADLGKVRKGEMELSQALDNIAAGLTGTGLMALGGLLRAAGVITGGGDDDDKQANQDDLTGHQDYALELGDWSVTLDWLAPEALPFFVGVELCDNFQEGQKSIGDVIEAMGSSVEPMLEMSMLQSLNELFESARYSQENAMFRTIVTAATSYFTQAIPTLSGQLARTLDGTRRTSATDPNSEIPSEIQYLLQQTTGKIPGLESQKEPYIDAWGREETSENPAMRIINNFLNPAYVSRIQETAVDRELQRLYDAGYDRVLPGKDDKTFSAGGEEIAMTPEEYTAYSKRSGQTKYAVLEGMMQTADWGAMTDAERAKATEDVYGYARDLARAEIAQGRGLDYQTEARTQELLAAEEVGIDAASWYAAKFRHDAIDKEDLNVNQKTTHFAAWLDEGDHSVGQKALLRDQMMFWQRTPGNADRYDELTTAARLENDLAAKVTDAMTWAEKVNGDADLSQADKYNVVFRLLEDLPAAQQYDALAVFETASSGNKSRVRTAEHYGVEPSVYVDILLEVAEAKDKKVAAGGTNSTSKADLIQVLNGAGLSQEQKRVLWPILSTANNPYGGQRADQIDWVYVP